MSAVQTVYANVAAMTVSVGGVTPAVKSLAQLPNSIATADLPMRLLLPTGQGAGDARGISIIDASGNVQVNWAVTDLMLWRPCAQGLGLRDVASDLITYIGAYVDALRTNMSIAPGCQINGANVQPGQYEYPQGSGNWYFGVQATLEVVEFL